MATYTICCHLDMVVTAVAHSPIVVSEPSADWRRLPDGFDDVDLAVLVWIAAEGGRLGRKLARN